MPDDAITQSRGTAADALAEVDATPTPKDAPPPNGPVVVVPDGLPPFIFCVTVN